MTFDASPDIQTNTTHHFTTEAITVTARITGNQPNTYDLMNKK